MIQSFPPTRYAYTDDCVIEEVKPQKKPYSKTGALGDKKIRRLLAKYRVLTLPQVVRLLKKGGSKRIEVRKSLKKMHLQGKVRHFRLLRSVQPVDIYTLPEEGKNITEEELPNIFALIIANEWHTLMLMHSARERLYFSLEGEMMSVTRFRAGKTSISLCAVPAACGRSMQNLPATAKEAEGIILDDPEKYGEYLIVVLCTSLNQKIEAARRLSDSTVFAMYHIIDGISDRNPISDLYLANVREARTELERVDMEDQDT